MGYYSHTIADQFYIAHEVIPDATFAVNMYYREHPWGNEKEANDYAPLEKTLAKAGYDLDFDYLGNVISINADSGKHYDADKLFDVLAPFVEDGSWIEWGGEEDSRWRFLFKEGKVVKQIARIVYGDV